MQITWNFYDKDVDNVITFGNRPHWDQSGTLTFVTFCLADSMPLHVIEHWKREQSEWLKTNGLHVKNLEAAITTNTLPEKLRRQFLKFRRQRWHEISIAVMDHVYFANQRSQWKSLIHYFDLRDSDTILSDL